MRILKFFLVSLVCVIMVTSMGFSAWMFISSPEKSPQIQSGRVTVEAVETTDIGLEILPPTVDGFLDYTISIQYGNENTHSNLSKDVCFMPFIRFKVSNYDLLAQNEDLYYYFTFSSTSSIFDSSENENGYIYFDQTKTGQSLEKKVLLKVRDSSNNLIYKTDENDQPILDELGNYIYELEFTFTPIFKYKSGKKPSNVSEYKQLLNLINNSVGENKITLHIISQ